MKVTTNKKNKGNVRVDRQMWIQRQGSLHRAEWRISGKGGVTKHKPHGTEENIGIEENIRRGSTGWDVTCTEKLTIRPQQPFFRF